MLLTDLVAKELRILKEAMPQATLIGVVWNPMTSSPAPAVKAVEVAGEKLGVRLHMVPVPTVEDLDGAFETMTREHVDGFLIVASPVSFSHRERLAELALKHRQPGMFGEKGSVEVSGLISSGADLNDLPRRAAIYIDKILKGAKPADLPVERASKYELVINLKIAKAIGSHSPSHSWCAATR
jgi:putative tryptophan/tyrosine transport system substrate-binding protein